MRLNKKRRDTKSNPTTIKGTGVDLMKTKEEYEKALKEINDAFYGANFLNNQTRRFDDNLNLLRELVNEHFEEKDKYFEEKTETNLEFYYDDLLEEGFSDFAVINGKIKSCLYVPCDKCEFKKKDCSKERITWLLSQRKKPKYKFTQFEYDLINTYRHVGNRCKFNGCYLLKSLKEKGHFKNVDKNELIKDILANCEVIK